MTIVIGSIVILLTFGLGMLLAFFFSRLDSTVSSNAEAIDLQDKGYNPALTMGFDIDTQAPPQEQVHEARKESAKLAASLPRGANARIVYSEEPGGRSASTGIDHDPWTAAKIAVFHGWAGARTGIPAGGIPEAQAVAPAAAAPSGKIELVPGKDYPFIEITDDMSADEKRKARIANSKAKSAAMKAAKADGAPVAAAAPAAVAPAAVAAAPAAVGIEAPELIPLTDDMSADEKRKARIANSKAKSAFNKALKAAGIDPKTVEIDDKGKVIMPQGTVAAPPTAVPAAAPSAAAPAAPGLAALGIEPPVLIVITDDMSADDKRKARISNSKAKSAFNKALKAAGIDPKSVEIGDDGQIIVTGAAVTAAAPASEAPVAPAAPAADSGAIDLAALGIEPPVLIIITDDMSADDKRQARIANSKAKSAFNKALKAAGIDPRSVSY